MTPSFFTTLIFVANIIHNVQSCEKNVTDNEKVVTTRGCDDHADVEVDVEVQLLPFGYDTEDEKVNYRGYLKCLNLPLNHGPTWFFNRSSEYLQTFCADASLGVFWFGPSLMASLSDGSFCERKFTHDIIAPFYQFFEDPKVDKGEVWNRVTEDPKELETLKKILNTNFKNVSANWAYIITYHNKSSWGSGAIAGCMDRRNTIQTAFVQGPERQSYVIFIYKELKWAAPCHNVSVVAMQDAAVGFAQAGIGDNDFWLPRSCTGEVLQLAKESNVGRPGVWAFRVDGRRIKTRN